MGCKEGSCSCGKDKQSSGQENQAMIRMSTGQGMMSSRDWKKGMGSLKVKEEVVEVRFKNKRKAFFRNPQGFRLQKDDRVVVEADTGYDLGTIMLYGEPAEKQFEKLQSSIPKTTLRKIYRKATETDLEKWLSAKRRERNTLLTSRNIASRLNLNMNIGDVEYQGDGGKLTVYHRANGRIDYHTLMEAYEDTFNVKVELKLTKVL